MNTTQKRIRTLKKGPLNGKTMVNNSADSSGIDRISNLPSEILCHILAFLPTKYAVGTCILSTRWKNLFSLIPELKLHLDESLLLHPKLASSTKLISFINFVNRLLNVTLCDVPSIHSLHLVCKEFNDGQEFANWIHAALCLNVKKLTLDTCQLKNTNFFFDSVFGSNIVSLDLLLDLTDEPHEFRFSLPILRKLSVQYMKSKLVNAILPCCPSLEHLVVYYCVCLHGEKLQICIPSLKTLKLVIAIYSVEGEIEIDAPSLEYLSYGGLLASRFLIQELKSLREARLDLKHILLLYPFLPKEPTIELLEACSNAERLWLSETLMKILFCRPRPMPRLPDLVFMMANYMGSHWWKMLPIFLKSAPKLNF